MRKPLVFIDADVLFAGAAGPSDYGASLVVLRMAEITLLEAITSQQVIVEAERNLGEKLPAALPAFRLLASRCLRIVPNPAPADLIAFQGLADAIDLPILAAALRERCDWLLTFNLRHYQPGHPAIAIVRPGDFLQQVRAYLANLSSMEEGE
ncbi:MAG: PIN domain-containing protein [Chloroflexi bacterium]|nr:PIN domain-containing protein [Chloroflexota bacterium]